MIFNKLQLILLVCFIQAGLSVKFSNLKKNHKPQTLTDSEVDYVSDLTDSEHLNQLYEKIAVPRVVGTKSHKKVHDFIVEQLNNLGYSVEIDDFEERTPNKGTLQFRNIIGRLNPDADRFLVLSCHYDSKYFKNEVFIGATDSAVPCAMILNLAKTMQNELNKIKDKKDVSLLLLFFDGEEAFKTWSATDSIYGARHLAEKWQKSASTRSGIQANHLERIDALVLLDLLGTSDPTFFSYFPETEKLFVQMSDAEDRIAARGHFKDYAINNPKQKYFKRRYSPSYVEDDHIPFYIRGVPILHLIPKEFPKVWHKLTDTMDAIDHNTVENLNKILRVFVAEYLHLPVAASSTGDGKRNISSGEL